MLFVSFVSVNAVTLSINQDSNIFDLERAETGNHILNFVASNVDEVISVDGGNQSFTYDYVLELTDTSEDFYIALENFFENSTYRIMYRGDLTKDSTLYVQELVLNENGQYIFKFSPSYDGEPIFVYIDLQVTGGSGVFNAVYIEEKPKGFNDLIGGFVNNFSAVFDINLKLWYLLYYLIIIVLVFAFFGILFGLSFFIITKAKEIKNTGSIFDMGEKKVSNNKSKEDE